jgi:hypothetical protein
VPGSLQITSSVAPVSALIGLNERLPQSLTQISSRIRGRIGVAEAEAIALDVLDHARLDQLARGVDDAAKAALGPDRPPQHAVGVDARELPVAERAVEAIEVPEGDAVHRPDHRGRVAEHGAQRWGDDGRSIGLDRED